MPQAAFSAWGGAAPTFYACQLLNDNSQLLESRAAIQGEPNEIIGGVLPVCLASRISAYYFHNMECANTPLDTIRLG